MIQLPKRSVTRFFIPLIDVLTLLFCIFLLMPLVQATDGKGDATGSVAGNTPLTSKERRELEELRIKSRETPKFSVLLEKEQEELEAFRKAKKETLQNRLAIRVLEIDADTGKLFIYDPDRVELTNEKDAHNLIERQKQETGGKELYYLFMFPRKITGFPEERQVLQYDRWFDQVAHGIDNPRTIR